MKSEINEKLALHGGPKAKTRPFQTGRRHGELEKQYLNEVIDSDMLFYFMGTKVKQFQREFAEMYGMKHCVACSSGTAAVHMAVASLELPPGTEVITSAITDMGTLTGILYQQLVPVFADVEADTLNINPADAEQRITARTGAIVVVHHSGLAADMDSFLEISRRHKIPIIEDCAQAYLCEYEGKLAGTFGAISAFSLNHFKHITCGSGGMILTNNDRLRYYCSLFLDKCYQREEGKRDPFFLAPNYQMTELQGAVALAQLQKLRRIIDRRRQLGQRLTRQLEEIPGIDVQRVPEGSRHSYFMYLFRLKLDTLTCNADEFSSALSAEGIPNAARRITGGMVEYAYQMFQHRSAYPKSMMPFVCKDTGANIKYPMGSCPVAERAFDEWITLDMSEHYSDQDIDEIAHGVRKVAEFYRKRSR
jgi:dTDP-4-amino-4,6-dideoxygalactose transaminase